MEGGRPVKIIVEGVILAFLLYLYCRTGIRNGAVGMVFLYEQEVQDRAVENGLITREEIEKRRRLYGIAGVTVMFVYLLVCVYAINGTRGFRDAFMELTVILMIAELFDRICIDWYWVGHTEDWQIPGTEDLKAYIPASAHRAKWLKTLIGCPAAAALVSFVFSLFLK
jgi:hypothetical protein